MKNSLFRRLAFPLALACLAPLSLYAAKPPVDPTLFSTLKWREVGPYRGGRVGGGDRRARRPQRLLLRRHRRRRLEDDGRRARSGRTSPTASSSGSIGAVAVAESDPNVIYVGRGEKTRARQRLARRRRLEVDRRGQDLEARRPRGLAADRPRPRPSQGSRPRLRRRRSATSSGPTPSAASSARKDGGDDLGARALRRRPGRRRATSSIDPVNPRVLYAAHLAGAAHALDSLESGGPGSGLWKIDRRRRHLDGARPSKPGLPKGTLGIIGVARLARQSRARLGDRRGRGGRRLPLATTAARPGRRTNEDRKLRQRAWYYTRIYADPKDADAVYVLNVQFLPLQGRRQDASPPIRAPHGDNHDLWIDPERPAADDRGERRRRQRLDSTAARTWTPQDNQPTAQFYRVIDRQPLPLPRLRRAAGQLDRRASASRTRRRRHRRRRLARRRRRRERLHRARTRATPTSSTRGCYGGYLDRASTTRTGELRDDQPSGPTTRMGWRRRGPEVPLPVELPDPLLAARPERRSTRRRNVLFQIDRRGAELGGRSRPT